MIHPCTLVKPVSPAIGNGVFATAFLPRGTIVVVRDPFDTVLSQDAFAALPSVVQEAMVTYLYLDKHGNFVLSWDHARHMNHSCTSNTMMTDYGIEVAVRDIQAGEEVTTEYGLLNILDPYEIACGCNPCRQRLTHQDIDLYGDAWDVQVKASLMNVFSVEQPLMPVVTPDVKQRLEELQHNASAYSSVKNLKWRA